MTGGWVPILREAFSHMAKTEKLNHTDRHVMLELLVQADHRTGTWPMPEGRQTEPTPGKLDALADEIGLNRKTIRASLDRLAEAGLVHVESVRGGARQGTVVTVLAYSNVVYLPDRQRERFGASFVDDSDARTEQGPHFPLGAHPRTPVLTLVEDEAIQDAAPANEQVSGTPERSRSDIRNAPDRTTGTVLDGPTIGALRRRRGTAS